MNILNDLYYSYIVYMNIIVFTDGSYMKRKVPIGGYGIYFPNGELSNISRKFKHPPITNQRAELYAIYVALVRIIKYLEFKTIHVYSDSMYSIKCLTEWAPKWIMNDWKTSENKKVKNKDILKPLYSIVKKYQDQIKFHHVKSHTKNNDIISKGNEMVDKLATQGALLS